MRGGRATTATSWSSSFAKAVGTGRGAIRRPGDLVRSLRGLRRPASAGAVAGLIAVIFGLYLSPYLLAAGYRIARDRPAPEQTLLGFAEFMGGLGTILLLGLVAACVWGVAAKRVRGFRLVGGATCGLVAAWTVLIVIQVRWPDVLWWEFVFYQVSGFAGGLFGSGLARALSGLRKAEARAVRTAQQAAADARGPDGVAAALALHLKAKNLSGIALFLDPDEGVSGSWALAGGKFDAVPLASMAPGAEDADDEGVTVSKVYGLKGVRFGLFVPLGEPRGTHGMLVAGFCGWLPPGARVRRRFMLATPAAALALKVRQKERRLATMDGQRRLARRMHDGHKQDLLSVPRHLRLVEQRLEEGDQAGALESLACAREGAFRAVREANALVRELKELGATDVVSLPERLAQLGRRVEREEGLQVELAVSAKPRSLGARTEEELFWVAREALGNVVRHAGASRCVIKLVYAQGMAAVEIRDDGKGFDTEATLAKPGYGLSSMRERAREVGGLLMLESAPGSGTSVLVSVSTPDDRREGGKS